MAVADVTDRSIAELVSGSGSTVAVDVRHLAR